MLTTNLNIVQKAFYYVGHQCFPRIVTLVFKRSDKKWQFPENVFAIMQLRDITSHLNRHVCVHTDSFKRSVVPRVLPFVIRFFFDLGFDLFCNLLWTADNFAWRCFTFLLRQRVSTALFHIGKKRQGWSNKKIAITQICANYRTGSLRS